MLAREFPVAPPNRDTGNDDFGALKAHCFPEEDAWDISAIAAFFALSSRSANLAATRPSDALYPMRCVPRAK
jgi:hypothetical protein